MPIPKILAELYEESLKRRSWVAKLVNESPEAPAEEILKTDPEEAALVRKIQSRIAYGLSFLNRHMPDLGIILNKLNVRIVNSNDPIVDTMAVDPVGNIYVNPKFSNELTDGEFYGVLAHEAMHHANGTFWRKKNRDHTLWNIATDAQMNWGLLRENIPLPKGAILPDVSTGEFEFTDLKGKLKNYKIKVLDEKGEPFSCEQIYDQLVDIAKEYEEKQEQGKQQGQGQ